MVGLLRQDVLGRFLQAAEGIDGDSGIAGFNRAGISGMAVQGRLRWHRPALTGVGTDRVQGRWAVASVVRISDGLAVQGHYPTGHQAVWGLYPVRKPRLQQLQVEKKQRPVQKR